MTPTEHDVSGGPASGGRVALVTNVEQYAGPGAAQALAAAGYTVVCHDVSFTDPAARAAFGNGDERIQPAAEQEPGELVDRVLATHDRLDVLVSNDFIPGNFWDDPPESLEPGSPYMRQLALEAVNLDELRATLEQLVVRPFALAKAVLPGMKDRHGGAILFITSAVSYRAGPRYEMYSASRSATTSFAQGLAVQAAPYGIQVNPIGPAWFANPTYYPDRHRERFMPQAEREVPLGRLGRQDEMGALIVFLASGDALPLTGQFLPFTSGTRLVR